MTSFIYLCSFLFTRLVNLTGCQSGALPDFLIFYKILFLKKYFSKKSCIFSTEPEILQAAPKDPIFSTAKIFISLAFIDNTMETKEINGNKLYFSRERYSIPIINPSQKRVIALGSEQNNCIALLENNRINISGTHRDTSLIENLNKLKASVEKSIFAAKPDAIVIDPHPGFNITEYAENLGKENNIEIIKVSHHISHIYSAALEHNLNNFVGIACDGTGFGNDNTVWGGEVFDNDKRVGCLEQHTMLGLDSAVVNPPKMLVGILSKFMNKEQIKKLGFFKEKEFELLYNQLEQGFNTINTTSTGRILDAASSLLGFCTKMTFPGEPAIKLEQNSTKPYELEPVIVKNKLWILQTTPLFKFLVENMEKDKKRLAATVQQYLAQGLLKIAKKFNKQIVFSGGCAYNTIMTTYMTKNNVNINIEIPPGDNGVCVGQLAYCLTKSML